LTDKKKFVSCISGKFEYYSLPLDEKELKLESSVYVSIPKLMKKVETDELEV
jgi:hypothetical protein